MIIIYTILTQYSDLISLISRYYLPVDQLEAQLVSAGSEGMEHSPSGFPTFLCSPSKHDIFLVDIPFVLL